MMGRLALLMGMGLLLTAAPALDRPARADDAAGANAIDPKKVFASNCSWCHGSFGMTADKGPRLAGTEMTEEQVKTRIRRGKEGYMPSFAKTLSEDEVAALASYIKSLKPPDE